MTSRQRVWLEIAIAFEIKPEERTKKQKALTVAGLCHALQINHLSLYTFYKKFRPDLPERELFWWPTRFHDMWRRQDDLERAFFAYLMVALSNEDYEEMIN